MSNELGLIKTTYSSKTVKQIYDAIIDGQINTNPISQRESTNDTIGCPKDRGIIESIFNGVGIGMITLRDIRSTSEGPHLYEENIKLYYYNNDFLVIDAGHRTRAIQYFVNGFFKVKVNGQKKSYTELSKEERDYFNNFVVNIDEKICSSQQAILIFRAINKGTKVNDYEMIMANDQSEVLKQIRMFYREYKEYDWNQPHRIFELSKQSNKEESTKNVAKYLGCTNAKARWARDVSVILLKSVAASDPDATDSDFDAGHEDLSSLVEREDNKEFTIQKKHMDTVKSFFDNLFELSKEKKRKITEDDFSAFECIWFELYRARNTFKFYDMTAFNIKFVNAIDAVKNCSDIIKGTEGEEDTVKNIFKVYKKSFSDGKKQAFAARLLLEHMLGKKFKGTLKVDADAPTFNRMGIVFPESKRSMSRAEREVALAKQNNKCFTCEKAISVDEAEFGHDTPHARGGKIEDGKVLCKACNHRGDTLTLTEVKKLQGNRSEPLELV